MQQSCYSCCKSCECCIPQVKGCTGLHTIADEHQKCKENSSVTLLDVTCACAIECKKELHWSCLAAAVHKHVLCAVVCCSSVYILQSLQVPHKAHRWSSSLKTSKNLLCINISRFEQTGNLPIRCHIYDTRARGSTGQPGIMLGFS